MKDRKETYINRKIVEEKMTQGKPEISTNTDKILEQRTKRTGDTYLTPTDRIGIG